MIVLFASLFIVAYSTFWEWLSQLPFTDFSSFLRWVTGPDAGGFVIISWAVAWGLDRFKFWNALDSQLKSFLILIISILFGSLAIVLANNPEIVKVIDPYFKLILSMVVMWLTTQVSHKNDPMNKKKETPVYKAERD